MVRPHQAQQLSGTLPRYKIAVSVGSHAVERHPMRFPDATKRNTPANQRSAARARRNYAQILFDPAQLDASRPSHQRTNAQTR